MAFHGSEADLTVPTTVRQSDSDTAFLRSLNSPDLLEIPLTGIASLREISECKVRFSSAEHFLAHDSTFFDDAFEFLSGQGLSSCFDPMTFLSTSDFASFEEVFRRPAFPHFPSYISFQDPPPASEFGPFPEDFHTFIDNIDHSHTEDPSAPQAMEGMENYPKQPEGLAYPEETMTFEFVRGGADSLQFMPGQSTGQPKKPTIYLYNIVKPGRLYRAIAPGETRKVKEKFWEPETQSFEVTVKEMPVHNYYLIGDNTLSHAQRPDLKELLQHVLRDEEVKMRDPEPTSHSFNGKSWPELLVLYVATAVAAFPDLNHHHFCGAVRVRFPDYRYINGTDIFEICEWLENRAPGPEAPEMRIVAIARHAKSEKQDHHLQTDREMLHRDLMQGISEGLDEHDMFLEERAGAFPNEAMSQPSGSYGGGPSGSFIW